MNSPFFSILLPTKNRSEILGGAIQSALDQTFGDFELIISDNDDSETASAKTVRGFYDPRIRYFRTSGKLPMHENWDFAYSQAVGQYVLVLEDKMRLVPNALSILHQHFTDKPGLPVCYGLKFHTQEILPGPAQMPPFCLCKSAETIESFTQFEQQFFEIFPKGLDSCAPRMLLDQVQKASPTSFLFSHLCPDYAYGFMLLSHIDSYFLVKEPLVFIPNGWMWQGKYSTGQSSYKKDVQIHRFLKDLPVTPEDILQHVPIKIPTLWLNLVVYDFLTKYKRPGTAPGINWVKYHAFCLVLILMGWRVGGDMRPELRALWKSLRSNGISFSFKVYADFLVRLCSLTRQAIIKSKS